jgi:TPR repeat protein
VTAALARALLPYPGLRPFERHEADIFFGRETQVDAMVDRLARHRLLAVTGSSGCGKSSLVRAGLLEALETGLLAAAGPVWRFATLRPGGHPMTEFPSALIAALDRPHTPDDVALRRAGLERGPLSLIEELCERPLPDGGNLLILVDQFEELFRYRSLAGREEAEAFVALLLASANEGDVPIYIVLTMRSDFLGRCAEFDGLAEAVTDAQYLCPRLSREQIAAAVEGPAKVFKGEVEPRLVAHIVNDMGTDPDQLPLMQHALMRLWQRARGLNPNAPLLRLDDYVAEGGIKGSLSRHADEILTEITRDMPERAETARRLFCLLVEGEGENAVRRLAPVSEIIAVTGKSLDESAAVADPFRAPGRSLLMPALDRPLACDTVLDISHESLIRQWQALKDWVRAEAASAEQYRDIERRARRWAAGSAAFLDGTDLDGALAWREREHPTAAWAARYGGDFALAMRFLDESRARRDAVDAERRERERRIIAAEEAVARQTAEAEAERRRIALEAAEERAAAANRLAKRTRIGLLVMSLLLVITAGLAWWGFDSAREAVRQRTEADRQKVTAEDAAKEAKRQRVVAEDAAKMAEKRLAEARLHQSRFLTEKAQEALHDGQIELAELAALSALPANMNAPDRTVWFPAVAALAEARSRDRERAVLSGSTSAAFSPDGARIVTASQDNNTARLWDAKTGALLAVLQGHTNSVNSAAFSPDGARVVTASRDKTARLWDAKTGAALAVLQGHTNSVTSAAFSPDEARIVTTSYDDNTARLWDAKTGAVLAVLQGHTNSVNSAAFSPDGARVVTASSDNTARLWEVWPLLTVDTVAYAEITALRALSKDERASLFLTEADIVSGQEHATATADDPGAMCDRLAGDPFDPHKGAPGVSFDNLDAEKAVPACRAAVEATPEEPRFSYQLGRTLLRADKRDDGAALVRAAAEKSYPAAQDALGDLFKYGVGVAKDDAQALLLYRQAAENGYAPAFSAEGSLYWEGIGTAADHAAAVRWFMRGVDHGDPDSHRRLAELYEIGDQLPQNLEKALFHHAIEAKLFEAAGYVSEAGVACARRGSLARALPPETAVRIAREAAAWHPKGP